MNIPEPYLSVTGINGLYSIIIVLVCIAVSWWSVQSIRLDLFLKNPRSGQAKLLQIIISLIAGYEVAKFIIDYFTWSSMLKWMF
ncbi:DUF1146 family protein [Ferviditalea candida]|uniref:DUF1146 family protein n=1 Tax=Ferviditalea candida TaxID=3108399 RepID=A0ABU5ZMJ4_9BACL|nr:DUF1146 family protein [Paenibacillaceae bacterium T2]